MKAPTLPAAAAWVASVALAFLAGFFVSGRGDREDPEVPGRTARPEAASAPGMKAEERPGDDPVRALSTIARLARSGTSEEFGAVVDRLGASWHRGKNDPVLQLCLEAWGRQGGAAAIEHLRASSLSAEFRGWALRHIVTGWGQADAPGALRWASESLRPSVGYEASALVAAITVASQAGEVEAAIAAAAKLQSGGYRNAAFDAIASALLAEKSPRDLVDWLEGDSPASGLADEFVRPLAHRLAARDPAKAGAWAMTLSNPNHRSQAIGNVARGWARQSPRDAGAWAESLPAGDSRSMALGYVAQVWADTDIQATGEWLNSLPETSDIDRAFAQFISDIAEDYPRIASEWANSINDPGARRAAVIKVSNVWRRTDSESALRWRDESLRR
ncbi:MAG: hypothetical protein HKN82_13985 [Akkermansiaceae bacterium]|nr:hypothetical protein [Akkermansiaceae bacterium]